MISLYNTLSRKKEKFVPTEQGKVKIYSCGPTVYNTVHIGNIRAFVFADLLQRWFRFGEKLETQWVMNITDVDDKTIRDSQNLYKSLDAKSALVKFTEKYTDLFFKDLNLVNIDKKHFLSNPRATHYIKEMQCLIQSIVDNGYAYVYNGSVYLDVQKYRKNYKYGELVSLNFENMESTSRVEDDEYEKSSANDFVLWKAKKEGEPFWDFKMTISTKNGESVNSLNSESSSQNISLPGRPGWHIECSAMSKALFPSFPFDIHTGGIDLCFPHHEDEICQSMAGYGEKTANYWMHNEHLMVEGKKMSKSLGNFYVLSDLEKKGYSADSLRFFFVINHYRGKVNLSDDSLKSAQVMLEKIRNYETIISSHEGVEAKRSSEKEVLGKEYIHQFVLDFFEAMQDDLNVSVAIAKFYSFMKNAAILTVDKASLGSYVEAVELVENVLGVSFHQQKKELSDEVMRLIEKRDEARREKNWELSDSLRNILQEKGFTVKDTATGTEVC